jgi:hypothetical protein
MSDLPSIAALTFALETADREDRAPTQEPFTDPAGILWQDGPPVVEAAPLAAFSSLRAWDDAIVACVAEDDALTLPSPTVVPSAAPMVKPPLSSLDLTLMMGFAVALWGTWEIRCGKDDRRLRRPST